MTAMVQRKNQFGLGDTDKNTFINGIKTFNSLSTFAGEIGGTYGTLVSIHRHQHNFHSPDGDVGTQRFLTWHRVYLSVLEHWVSSITNYQKFFIPYWNWTTNRTIPDWLRTLNPKSMFQIQKKSLPDPDPLLGKMSLYSEILENPKTFLQESKSLIVWRCHRIQNLLRLSRGYMLGYMHGLAVP